jgi:hypothetical protein
MTDTDPWIEDAWLATTIIPHELLRAELDLAVSKWPNYRFMTPLRATRLFKEAYVAEYRRYHARNIDYREAEALKIGHKLDLAHHSTQNTQLWRARQIADGLGMPYGAYLEFAFAFAEGRRRKYAPQPNQLGPSERSAAAWSGKLAEFWTPERKWLALEAEEPLPEYRLSNDLGLTMQGQFRAELLDLGRSGAINPEAFLDTHVVTLEQLTPAECEAAFPGWIALESMAETLDAKAAGIIAGHPYSAIDPSRIRPSCYGLPGINATAEARCQICGLRPGCHVQRREILDQLVIHFGTTDPIAGARRAGNAERQRRHRARQKGLSPVPTPGPVWRTVIRKALSERVNQPQQHPIIEPNRA